MANDHNSFPAGSDRQEVADREGTSLPDGEMGVALDPLRDSRRWKVVQILEDERDRTIERCEIARRIAAAEADAQESPDRLVRCIEISLHHKHLPALDEADVVDYDPDAGLATYAPCPEFARRVRAVVE